MADFEPVTYNYAWFHLIFSLASMYIAMLMTGWGSGAEEKVCTIPHHTWLPSEGATEAVCHIVWPDPPGMLLAFRYHQGLLMLHILPFNPEYFPFLVAESAGCVVAVRWREADD